MLRRRPTEIVWGLIAAMVLAPCAACQQQPGAPKPDAAKPGSDSGSPEGGEQPGGPTQPDAPLDLGYLTETATFAGVVHPRRALTDPELELLPIEVLSAAGKKEMGIDPLDVEQVLVMAEPPLQGNPPQAGVVVRFSKPHKLDQILPQLQAATVADTLDGKAYRRGRTPMDLSLYAVDDRTLLMAHDELLRRMLSGESDATKGLAGKLLSESGSVNDVAAVLAVEPLRPLVAGQIAMAPLPPAFESVRKIPELLSAVEATVSLSGGMRMALVLHAEDEAAAEELETIIVGLLDTAQRMIHAQMTQAVGTQGDDPVQQAAMQYVQRINKRFMEAMKPKRDGSRLEFATEGQSEAQIATIGILIALLLPAIQAAREAARRAKSVNNMKQIMLAMHVHHDARKRFPARANFDENGKPLLSWRVHILPYIDEEPLYRQFKLDEPWDSPHNRELIAKMPDIYRNPSSLAEPGMSDYLVVTGEGTMFEGTEGRRYSDVRDGTSNTIVLVEVDPEEAVIWTKPDDWELDPDDPLAGLGYAHPAGFGAGFGDGSVQTIPADVDPEVFKAMCTIAGREQVSRDF